MGAWHGLLAAGACLLVACAGCAAAPPRQAGPAPRGPTIVVAPTPTATPTPRSTPTPTITATPTTTATPAGPQVEGSDAFRAAVNAALVYLRADPDAFRRYETHVLRVAPAPAGAVTDALVTGDAARRTVRLGPQDLNATADPVDNLRILAARLNHQATHVAMARGEPGAPAPQVDRAYLEAAYGRFWLSYRARAQARARAEGDRLRAQRYPDCDGRPIPEHEACRAAVDRAVEQAVAQALANLEASVQQQAAADPIAAYLELFRGRPLTPAQVQQLVAGKCWAYHNELLTYLRLGGSSLEGVAGILALSTPACRSALGIG